MTLSKRDSPNPLELLAVHMPRSFFLQGIAIPGRSEYFVLIEYGIPYFVRVDIGSWKTILQHVSSSEANIIINS